MATSAGIERKRSRRMLRRMPERQPQPLMLLQLSHSMASSWQVLMEFENLAHRLGGFEQLQFESVQAAGMNSLLCHDGPPVRFQDMCASIHCLQPSQ